jgi:F0F1-type ATP synthase assembly protein I
MKMRAAARPPSGGVDQGWAVLSTMISGLVVFGGLGWLLDHWWNTRLMTPTGLVIGMALGIYAVVMRFGRPGESSVTSTPAQKADATTALRAAKLANREKAFHREREVRARVMARPISAEPADGPPSAGTRRETECP